MSERLAAVVAQQAEQIAEQRRTIQALMAGMDDTTTPVIRRIAALEVERDAAREQVRLLELAEEGAKEAFGVVVQEKRDLEAEVKRLQTLLDGAHQIIRNQVRQFQLQAPAGKGNT